MKAMFLIFFLVICLIIKLMAHAGGSPADQDTVPATKITTNTSLSSLPLAQKTFGIEFSPVRYIVGLSDDIFNTQINAGVSLFSIDRRAEIAMPILFMFGKFDDIPSKIINIDATYRRFFDKQQKGFYYSAGLRYNFLQGPVDSDDPSAPDDAHGDEQITQSRMGVYIGVGYRYFSKRGWYWGTSLICGPYFGKLNPKFNLGYDLPPLTLILAWDLFKFGYAF